MRMFMRAACAQSLLTCTPAHVHMFASLCTSVELAFRCGFLHGRTCDPRESHSYREWQDKFWGFCTKAWNDLTITVDNAMDEATMAATDYLRSQGIQLGYLA